MARKKNAPPKTAFSRTSKLLGLAASLAQKEVSYRLGKALRFGEKVVEDVERVKIQVQQAQSILKELSQLKGAAMKAGQMLLIELRDYLPPPVIEVLSKLQDQSSSVSLSEIEPLLKKEWGEEKFLQVKEISPEAIGAASIGQVHSANWNGKKIAIKIQYEGIAETIDSDLKILSRVAKSLLGLTFKNVDLEGVLEEVSNVLKLETQYLHEMQMMSEYKEFVKNDSLFVVPTPVVELTTSKVLAMSFEEGTRLSDWIEQARGKENLKEMRQQFGAALLNLYFKEFYEWGLVQTDPNFGNFLVREKFGKLEKIVLLDFGATKSYRLDFRKKYGQMIFAVYENRRDDALGLALELQMFDPRESEEVQELLWKMISGVMEVFQPHYQPFTFDDETYLKNTRAHLFEFMRKLKYSAPPKQILFLHRKLGGVFALLKNLRLEADLQLFMIQLDRWLKSC